MKKSMIALLFACVLAVSCASVLLLSFFHYNACELLKEFCISSIVAGFISIPNIAITSLHDRKEIKRKRLGLVKALGSELQKIQELCKKDIDESLKEIEGCAIRVDAFVANLTVELSDNQMGNTLYEELLEKAEKWLRSVGTLKNDIELEAQEEVIRLHVAQVGRKCDDCLDSINKVVKCCK